jgi:hypothetical protein
MFKPKLSRKKSVEEMELNMEIINQQEKEVKKQVEFL